MHSISYLIYRFLIACILYRISDVIVDVYDVRVRFKYFAIINKKNKKCLSIIPIFRLAMRLMHCILMFSV